MHLYQFIASQLQIHPLLPSSETVDLSPANSVELCLWSVTGMWGQWFHFLVPGLCTEAPAGPAAAGVSGLCVAWQSAAHLQLRQLCRSFSSKSPPCLRWLQAAWSLWSPSAVFAPTALSPALPVSFPHPLLTQYLCISFFSLCFDNTSMLL